MTPFNNFLWIITIIIIFVSGLFFSFKIKFAQFKFKEVFKILKEKEEKGSISPLSTLTITLAARIGVGTISGVALAIYLGGPGSILWMWLAGLIASSNTFLESVLGVIYHKKDENNIYKGGPSYYLDSGANKKILAKIYAVLIIIAYIGGFLTIQSNTIAIGVSTNIGISPLLVGIIIASIAALIIIKGIKGIADATNFLVPFMGLIYTIVCLIIILININYIPKIFADIFLAAFNFKAAGSGIVMTIIIGIQRSIFSSEAGVGTGAIAAATCNTDNPCTQGYIQSFSIFIDTIFFGTLTALVIMCSNYNFLNIISPNGIEIAEFAFHQFLGYFGSTMLIIVIVLFAFSSIITGYYYGESSLKFIKKNTNKFDILILKIITILLLVIGSISSSKVLWMLVDIFVAILAIINIYALWLLKGKVFELLAKRKK